jgi:hypothetical protein
MSDSSGSNGEMPAPQGITRREFNRRLVFGVGGALAWALLGCDTQPQKEVIQRISTRFGVNTHLHAVPYADNDTMTPANFTGAVEFLARNGMQAIRFDVRSDQITNPADLSFNPERLAIYKAALQQARAKGIDTYLVSDTPSYIRDLPHDVYKIRAVQYYANLAKELAGQVSVWQLFNESDTHNYKTYEGIPEATAEYLAQFAQVVDLSSKAIRTSDPGSLITVSTTGVDPRYDLVEVRRAYLQAVRPYIDLNTVDLYPGTNMQAIAQIPDMLRRLHKEFGLPLSVGEIGMSSVWGSPDQYQTYIPYAIDQIKSVANEVDLRSLMIYEYMNEPTAYGPQEQNFGLVYASGTPKFDLSSLTSVMKPEVKVKNEFNPLLYSKDFPDTEVLPHYS